MDVRVHGRNVEVTNRVRSHAEKRISRSAKYFDRVGDADVEILEEANQRIAGGRWRAEITAPVAGYTVRAQGSGESIQAAVDAAAERFGSSLRKLHDRLIERNRGSRKKGLNLTSQPTEDDGELDTPEIVRVKQFVMKPMTPDDAAMAMDQLGHSFFFFYNAESDLPSVLYNRRDGRLGLIEPK